MLDCALISADEGFRHSVLGLVRQSGHQARLVVDLLTTGDQLGREDLEKIFSARPQVVFLDLGESPSGVGTVQVLSQEAPDMALVVAGPSLSAEGLLSIMRAGAAEYLPRPFSNKETSEAFARIRRKTRPARNEASGAPGKVITIFSAKGGAGVTTVATNLAVALKASTEKEVLLLDSAPALGTAAIAMGLQPRYSYFDVVQNFHRIDEELFRSFLAHHESGVHLLSSPGGPTGMDPPTASDLQGLLSLCRQHFDYVVVDAGTTLSPQLLAFLGESDERVLVATPELSSLRNLKQALDLYGRMDGKPPPRIVLNQYEEKIGLSQGDVEEALGQRLTSVLEKDDARIFQSINLGRPEVQQGRSRFAKSVKRLGVRLTGEEMAREPRKGFLSRFFKSSKAPDKGGKESP